MLPVFSNNLFLQLVLIYLMDSASSADDIKTICINFPRISCDPNDVSFYLYPNPRNLTDLDELIYSNMKSITKSRFDPKKKLILLTHGFTQNFLSDFPTIIKNAYLQNGYATNTNIVAVDWGRLSAADAASFVLPIAETLAEVPEYLAAVKNVKVVGQRITDFIIFLIKNKQTSANRVHLIGHSLGAHASGYAGSVFIMITNQILARITGTDPAGPLFFPIPFYPLIDKNVAGFVDIIHTNRGEFGYPLNLGQIDFNVNGGGPFQPGCTNVTDVLCAHNKAPHYYAQSIATHNLLADCILCLPFTVIFGEFCPPGSSGYYDIIIPSTYLT